MNWKFLYFGRLNKEEILKAVQDEEWQKVRLSMKGKTLENKYNILSDYVHTKEQQFIKNDMIVNLDELLKVYIRSTNYVTALSRGGLIKPSDYR